MSNLLKILCVAFIMFSFRGAYSKSLEGKYRQLLDAIQKFQSYNHTDKCKYVKAVGNTTNSSFPEISCKVLKVIMHMKRVCNITDRNLDTIQKILNHSSMEQTNCTALEDREIDITSFLISLYKDVQKHFLKL